MPLSFPPRKDDGRFNDWMVELYRQINNLQPLDEDLTEIATLSLTGNQLLGKDSAGTGWEGKTLTEGSNITITHSAGGIEIAASGSGGGATSNVLSADLTIDADTSYIVLSYFDLNGHTLTVNGNFGVI